MTTDTLINAESVSHLLTAQPQTSRQIAAKIYECDPASLRSDELDPVSKALSYLKRSGLADSKQGAAGINYWYTTKAKAAMAEKVEAAIHNRVVPASEADSASMVMVAISGALDPVRQVFPNEDLTKLAQIAANSFVYRGSAQAHLRAVAQALDLPDHAGPKSLADVVQLIEELRDTLTASQQEARDYSQQTENLKAQLQHVDTILGGLHEGLTQFGMEQGHILDRVAALMARARATGDSRVKAQPSQAVASDDDIVPSNKSMHLDESPAISAYLIELAGKVLTRQSVSADTTITILRPDDRNPDEKPISLDDVYYVTPDELTKILDAMITLKEART